MVMMMRLVMMIMMMMKVVSIIICGRKALSISRLPCGLTGET